MNKIKDWWENTSKAYQETATISTDVAHYGPFAPDESELNLLGNISGKKIIEVGCGGGQCSFAFTKQGATCTGVDLSEEQIKFARDLAQEENVEVDFIEGDYHDLDMIPDKSFDIAFSAFAFQYAHDLNKVFSEVSRVLKDDGQFVFSLDHPFFLNIDPKTNCLKDSYFNNGRHEFPHIWGDHEEGTFVFYNHTISDIYNALVSSGFLVEKIIEPHKLEGQDSWNKDKWKNTYPMSLVELLGPTIIFKTKKL